MHDVEPRLAAALGGRYAIGRALGTGGMATVYLAEDLKHHRKVAVKVLRRDLAASLGAERFLREIEIAARLQHPHILPLLDSGDADGFLYYVMPYVDGESLRDRLSRERELPVADAARVLRDVVDALAYAHQQGVVHRDVKPENILLSGRHAVVADFGVAKAISDATASRALTTAGMALGTPAYMAPEQASADTNIDHRADIYAVGVVAFELLTGQPPFTGLTAQAVLAGHITRTPESVTALRPQVPLPVAELVRRCLEKRPADRWQRAEEMLPALEAVATTNSGGTTSAATPPASLPGRRRRMLTAALAAAVMLMVSTAGVVRYRATRPTESARRRVVVVVPPANRTGNAALDHLAAMAADWLSRGLLEIGEVQAVSAGTAMAVKSGLSAQPGVSSGALSRRVATETGAGLMVSGAYYPTGDSIRFQLQLSDVATDRLIASIDPVTVPVRDPMPGLDVLRRRVAGAVAQSVDPKSEGRATMFNPPPSYEAYRFLTESMQAFNSLELGDAERLVRRALAVDSTYQSARASLSLILLNEGRDRETDSLLHIIESDQSRLTRTERLTIEWQRAVLNGDHQASYRSAQEMVSVDPSMLWLWILSFETARLNRPAEALALLARVDPRNVQMDRNWPFWITVTDAHHMLKQHDGELTAARAARAQYPTVLSTLSFEAIALAALDRAPEVERLLDQSVDLPPKQATTLGEVVVDVGLEFSAHGDSAAAHRANARAISWYDALPREQQGAERRLYAEALYAGGRWLDARRVLDDACRATPMDVACLGMSGTIAARLGERDRAHQIGEQLADLQFYPPKQEGDALLRRSYIAAALGERDLAVTLLRRAFAKGVSYSSALHRQPDLRLLQGYAPFEELLRPKG